MTSLAVGFVLGFLVHYVISKRRHAASNQASSLYEQPDVHRASELEQDEAGAQYSELQLTETSSARESKKNATYENCTSAGR